MSSNNKTKKYYIVSGVSLLVAESFSEALGSGDPYKYWTASIKNAACFSSFNKAKTVRQAIYNSLLPGSEDRMPLEILSDKEQIIQDIMMKELVKDIIE